MNFFIVYTTNTFSYFLLLLNHWLFCIADCFVCINVFVSLTFGLTIFRTRKKRDCKRVCVCAENKTVVLFVLSCGFVVIACLFVCYHSKLLLRRWFVEMLHFFRRSICLNRLASNLTHIDIDILEIDRKQ